MQRFQKRLLLLSLLLLPVVKSRAMETNDSVDVYQNQTVSSPVVVQGMSA